MGARLELAEAAAYAALCESAGLPVLRLGGASCTAVPFLRDASYRNILRAGFAEAYLRPNLMAPRASANH